MPSQQEGLLSSAPKQIRESPPSERVKLDLAAEVLHRFGEVRFVARGSSMIPSIYPGDLLTVRSQAIAEVQHGHIVLALREGRFWAHRLIRKWREGNRFVLTTRGDALPNEDPSLDESQVLGRVTSIVRYGETINFALINSASTRLLRCAVRNSNALAKALLRRHSLRLRLLGRANDAYENPGTPILECL
jgi:Peptidase S24-like